MDYLESIYIESTYLDSTYDAHCKAIAFWKKMENDLRQQNEARIAKWKKYEMYLELTKYTPQEKHIAIQQMQMNQPRIDRIKELYKNVQS